MVSRRFLAAVSAWLMGSLLLFLGSGCPRPAAETRRGPSEARDGLPTSADLRAARDVFEANIRAIQNKDREAYLACYLPTPDLLRAGGSGVKLGFAPIAKDTPASGDAAWPSRLEATEIEVHPVAPGVVYGAYRYVVTLDGETTTGLSERLFVRQADGWRIAVTTAFEVPPKAAVDRAAKVIGNEHDEDAGSPADAHSARNPSRRPSPQQE